MIWLGTPILWEKFESIKGFAEPNRICMFRLDYRERAGGSDRSSLTCGGGGRPAGFRTQRNGFRNVWGLVAMNVRRGLRESPHYKAQDWSEL